jgi:HK97 family phage portal protein
MAKTEKKVADRLSFPRRLALATAMTLMSKVAPRGEVKGGEPAFPQSFFSAYSFADNWNGASSWARSFFNLSTRGGGFYPGSNIDYVTEVGDLMSSSMVMAAWQFIGTALTEAPPQVLVYDDPKNASHAEPDPEHPLVKLFEQPNPYYDSATMMQAFALDWLFSGNVYWVKVRDKKYLTPVQLWTIPHFMMYPASSPSNPQSFIDQYVYVVNGNQYVYPVDDIVHIRRGQNPRDLRRGIGVFDSVLREIYTDQQVSNFTAAIVKNHGIVPFVISPPKTQRGMEVARSFGDDVEQVKQRASEIKQQFIAGTTGDNRGEPIVNTIPLEITKLGFSPAELDLSSLHKVPESRIAGVTGLPASLLQFVIGLENGTSYASYKEAREQAYESVVVPLLARIASAINKHLLPDFGDVKGRRTRFAFDLSQVRVLQDDRDKLFQRISQGVSGGWLKVSDARAAVNLNSEDSDEVYLRAATVVAMKDNEPVTGPNNEVAPPPAPPAIPGAAPAATVDGNPADEPTDPEKAPAKPAPKQLPGKKVQLLSDGHLLNGNGRHVARLLKDNRELIVRRLLDSSGCPTKAAEALVDAAVEAFSDHNEAALRPVGPTPLDKRLIDNKPARSLSDDSATRSMTSLLHDAGHVVRTQYYSQLPFLGELHRLMGVDDPMKVPAKDYLTRRDALFQTLPVSQVALGDLVATQDNINVGRVQQIQDEPETAGTVDPFFARYHNETYVVNGHHRVAAEVLAGHGTMPGHVLEFIDDANGNVVLDPSAKLSPATRLAVKANRTTAATAAEAELLTDEIMAFLEAVSSQKGSAPAGWAHGSVEELVLQSGERFKAVALPPGVDDAALGQAYRTAFQLVDTRPDLELEYVEGFANLKSLPVPIRHAWTVTKAGQVVDPTFDRFRRDGKVVGYVGVRIPTSLTRLTVIARERYGVLDDPERGYPVLKMGLKYSPEQARDDHGRFGDESGSGQQAWIDTPSAAKVTPSHARSLGIAVTKLDSRNFDDIRSSLGKDDRKVLDQLAKDFSVWDLTAWKERLSDGWLASGPGGRLGLLISGYANKIPGLIPELHRGVANSNLKVGERIELPTSDWTPDKKLAASYGEADGSQVLHLPTGSQSMPSSIVDKDPPPFDRWLNWGGRFEVDRVEGKDVYLKAR